MHLLYYWRSFQDDLGNPGSGRPHLNQDTPTLHEVEPGESIWAFTRNGEGDYALVAQLVVDEKATNSPDYPHSEYRVIGANSAPPVAPTR